MRLDIQTGVAVDLDSAAGVKYTYITIGACYLLTDHIQGVLEEAIATGGFTTAAPLVTVAVGGTAVATFTTTSPAAAGGIIGKAYLLTPNTTNTVAGQLAVAANVPITVTLTTQGTGGTVTGTLRVYLPIEENLS